MDSLYTDVVAITEQYLGPAAERFVIRHIQAHLDKLPQEITPQDLPHLAEWARVSMGLLTSNPDTVENYARKITDLAAVREHGSR